MGESALLPDLCLDASGKIPGILLSGSGEEFSMAKVLRCRDLGMNCPKEVRAESDEELLKLAAEHAEKDHGISAAMIPPSILAMVKAAIKDE
jgi:predicted small metal-binding protein